MSVMDHPETYTLTRDEWLAVNRALAGASLAMWFMNGEKNRARYERVRGAQDILSESYQRAKEEVQ